MGHRDDDGPLLPPRIKAAFEFLYHTRMVTEQVDATTPTRDLSTLERSVETAALRAIQQYLLGEMVLPKSPRRPLESATMTATRTSRCARRRSACAAPARHPIGQHAPRAPKGAGAYRVTRPSQMTTE